MYAGKKIKSLRNELGLNQEEFSKELNISQSYYSAIESGKKKVSKKIASTIIGKWGVNIAIEKGNKLGGINGGENGGTGQNAHLEARAAFDKAFGYTAEDRLFSEGTDMVPHNYIIKVYDLLRTNNPELHQLNENIDVILGFGLLATSLETELFKDVMRSFSRYKKGKFDLKDYEAKITVSLQKLEHLKPALDKIAVAIKQFYAELKVAGVKDIDFDNYS